MINKTGYTGVAKNSSNSYSPSTPPQDISNGKVIFGKVKDITLNSDDYPNLGEITFTNLNDLEIGTARPFSSNLNIYPAPGELVVIFSSKDFLDDSLKTNYFYLPSLNIIRNPNSNAISIPLETDPSPTFGSPSQPEYPSYIKSNIHPLFPYTYDVTIEGSFGSSLRFGSTNKSKTKPNQWSDNGEEYSPITILSNGHNPSNNELGFYPTVEDINKDLSSIYLTSTQTISSYSPSSTNYNSFTTPPILPSQYSSPQIICNSDQIFIGSKKDNILLNSKKSIGLSSLVSANIDSPSTIIQSNNIFLGDKSAIERGVKGDTLHNKLNIILSSLITLIKVLEVQQIWPGGVPSPDGGTMMISGVVKKQLEEELKSLSDILSKCVKTI